MFDVNKPLPTNNKKDRSKTPYDLKAQHSYALDPLDIEAVDESMLAGLSVRHNKSKQGT